MPSCCAVNCTNRKTKNNELAFYRIPKTQERREEWLQAMKRKGWGNEQDLKYATLCSAHFISGIYV